MEADIGPTADSLASWAKAAPPAAPLDLYALVAGLAAEYERLMEWLRMTDREMCRVETLHDNGEATDDHRQYAVSLHREAWAAVRGHERLMDDVHGHIQSLANRLRTAGRRKT